MQIHITEADGTPFYQQVVNQVKLLVASGRLEEGEQLPPVRKLAEKLLVNPNTIARAYRELESEGVGHLTKSLVSLTTNLVDVHYDDFSVRAAKGAAEE